MCNVHKCILVKYSHSMVLALNLILTHSTSSQNRILPMPQADYACLEETNF